MRWRRVGGVWRGVGRVWRGRNGLGDVMGVWGCASVVVSANANVSFRKWKVEC